ncbi:MAG: DUF2585 family protein [Alphaproteobacteria bacterium]|nr:DUF2585 family protein [Alphaproteobacteria bacterium]
MARKRATLGLFLLIACAILGLQALTLLIMGQPFFCACGTLKLWHGLASSPETSQHLLDWYSLSHVIHGVIFYGLLWLAAPRRALGPRLILAVMAEGGWEILENTPFLIDRYRQSALAQGYFGDSIVNSLSDSLSMATGFAFAHKLPWWSSLALVLALEAFAGYMIRDNLSLNIIHLVAPNAALSRWQMGD